MSTRSIKSIFFIILGIVLMSPLAAYAQFATDPTGLFVDDPSEQSVEVTVTPENPQPGQAINFKVVSYLSDLERSTITWLVNGKQAAKGIGLTTFSTVMGTIGKTTQVDLRIVTNEGITIERTFSYIAAKVDLVWEAESYTPPFYKGKALFSRYQKVKIVALPQFGTASKSLSSTDLIYTWKKNGRVLGSRSGYGKNTLLLEREETGKEVFIEVAVSNRDENLNASNEIFITPVEPALVLYAYSPANGIMLHRAFSGQIRMTAKELSIAAVPYYFSIDNDSVPYLNYEWRMNGKKALGMIEQVFAVGNLSSTSGATTIESLVVNESDGMSQKATASFMLNF